MRTEKEFEIPSAHKGLEAAWEVWVRAARRELGGSPRGTLSGFPHFSEKGRWHLLPIEATSTWTEDRYEHGNWTAGFWFGVSWLLALHAGDEWAAEAARDWLEALAARAEDTTTHDLGFLFFPGFVLGHEAGFLGKDETGPAIRAAEMMTRRFNHRGEYIQAFGPIGDPRSAGTSTIDTMMNLPLLWWAAANGADPVVLDVAQRHARTSGRVFLRPDGSTYHLVMFDPVSGAVLSRGTFQGEEADSCWSRGQAWAVSGFSWAYAATGEPELLETAEVTAAYFFDRLGADALPPWDFSDRSTKAPRDASAAAIAALGACILGSVHPDPKAGGRYARLAADTLQVLSQSSLNTSSDEDGILLHCCYSKPDGLGIDGACGWGDFYLGLALALAREAIPLGLALGLSTPLLPGGSSPASQES